MPIKNLVTGQKISQTMYETARRLRREMTEEELILWQHLHSNRLEGFHFRRQQIIGKYIVDFYCRAANLVIELDGEIHDRQVERDRERENDLTARGLRILRFKNAEIQHKLQGVLDQIADACRIPPSL
jgi:very-short-patch-repair endonuclease